MYLETWVTTGFPSPIAQKQAGSFSTLRLTAWASGVHQNVQFPGQHSCRHIQTGTGFLIQKTKNREED